MQSNCSQDTYKKVLHLCLDNGWLLPYPEDKLGPPKYLISLMTALQKNMHVCPVLNYREVNGFVNTYNANSEVCAQKLQEWQQGIKMSLLDLTKVPLQINTDKA